jgi:hypothetical protein
MDENKKVYLSIKCFWIELWTNIKVGLSANSHNLEEAVFVNVVVEDGLAVVTGGLYCMNHGLKYTLADRVGVVIDAVGLKTDVLAVDEDDNRQTVFRDDGDARSGEARVAKAAGECVLHERIVRIHHPAEAVMEGVGCEKGVDGLFRYELLVSYDPLFQSACSPVAGDRRRWRRGLRGRKCLRWRTRRCHR